MSLGLEKNFVEVLLLRNEGLLLRNEGLPAINDSRKISVNSSKY